MNSQEIHRDAGDSFGGNLQHAQSVCGATLRFDFFSRP